VFYKANDLSGYHVADPFMGGGTPILEANRVGCDVTAFDINPMSYWIVKQEIEHLDLGTPQKSFAQDWKKKSGSFIERDALYAARTMLM